MLKHKSYKFRIYPTEAQKVLLNKTFVYVKQDLKLADRQWVCSSCKVRNDRDLLASINILEEGLRITSVGVDAD